LLIQFAPVTNGEVYLGLARTTHPDHRALTTSRDPTPVSHLIEVDNQILNFPSSLRFCAMPHLVSTSKEKNMDVENSGAQPTGRWLCAGRHEGVEALERDRLPRKGPGIRSRRGC